MNKSKIKELEDIREFLRTADSDDIQLFTYNIQTGSIGMASFYNDNKTIKVFEGNGDGSDDKEIDYDDFINNYEYKLAYEYESIDFHKNI